MRTSSTHGGCVSAPAFNAQTNTQKEPKHTQTSSSMSESPRSMSLSQSGNSASCWSEYLFPAHTWHFKGCVRYRNVFAALFSALVFSLDVFSSSLRFFEAGAASFSYRPGNPRSCRCWSNVNMTSHGEDDRESSRWTSLSGPSVGTCIARTPGGPRPQGTWLAGHVPRHYNATWTDIAYALSRVFRAPCNRK